MIGRDDALALDAADPLARWRDEFVIPDPELIYLDGNSLGRTPKRTVAALHRVVDEVGRRPDRIVVGTRLAESRAHRR